MSGGYGTPCPECVACEADCDATAYCLSEPGTRPCPHDRTLCPDCLDGCPDCRRDMETELYRSGEYNPLADPFINTHAPVAVDRVERDGGYYWLGAWVEVKR